MVIGSVRSRSPNLLTPCVRDISDGVVGMPLVRLSLNPDSSLSIPASQGYQGGLRISL